MERKLNQVEIIQNQDESVYHLNLLPGEVAETILTVGDPDRVEEVSKHFDKIELKKRKREFVTHTGYIGNKRISVISTGIGYGGVEIVMTEIDQLFNFNFQERTFKSHPVSLQWIRLGTSGSISDYLQVGDIAITEFSAGFSQFHELYQGNEIKNLEPFTCSADPHLLESILRNAVYFKPSNTLTLPGFYLPQGRTIRSMLDDRIYRQLIDLRIAEKRMHHLEMETAAIFQLAQIYGHQACSISAILADRKRHQFHPQPEKLIDQMISETLVALCS